MGKIIAIGTFYDNTDLKAIAVQCDKPDRAGNWYYVEIVREYGERFIWVRTWHSDPKWYGAVNALRRCTI